MFRLSLVSFFISLFLVLPLQRPLFGADSTALLTQPAIVTDTIKNVPPDSQAIMHVDRMTVTGKSGQRLPPSVVILKPEDYTGLYKDLPSVLEEVPGIVVHRSGAIGEYTETSTRGGSSQELGVFLDGIQLNNATGGGVDLGKLSLGGIQKIEVFKSTAPLDLDGQSTGGVINLTTDISQPLTSGSVEMGSFYYRHVGAILQRKIGITQQRLVLDYTGALNNYPFHFDHRTPYNPSDDVWLYKSNNDFSVISGQYALRLPIGEDFIQGNISFRENKGGVFIFDLADTLLFPRYQDDVLTGALRWNTAILKTTHNLEFATKWQHSYFVDSLGQFGYGQERKEFLDLIPMASLSYNGQWFASVATTISLIAKAKYEHWRHLSTTPEHAQWSFSRRIAGLIGAEVSWRGDSTKVLRIRSVERVESDSTDLASGAEYLDTMFHGSNLKMHPNIEAEGLLTLSKHVDVFGISRYVTRSPSFYEKFGRGARFYGNPKLRDEKKFEYELGINLLSPLVKAHITWFQNWGWDRIVILGTIPISRPSNASRIDCDGLETEVSVRLQPWLHIKNTLTLMRAVFGDYSVTDFIGKQVPYQSTLKELFHISANWNAWELGHRFSYSSPYYTGMFQGSTTKKTQLPVTDIWISYEGLKTISMTYRIENYLNVINEDFPDSPLPGQMHFFNISFNLK